MKIDDLQKSMNSTLINNLGESRAYRKTEEQNSASTGEGKSVDCRKRAAHYEFGRW
ncbi:hypothetical protein ACFL9T_22550 [Thermodesulfobacteriota bacterium]